MSTQDMLVRDFRIALEDFGNDVDGKSTLVLREVGLTTAEAIVIGNAYGPGAPLDTGFLRSSFRIGIGEAVEGPTEPPKTPGRKDGDPPLFATALNTADAATVKLGDAVYITTGVEYAVYLEENAMTRRNGPAENVGASTQFIAPVEQRFPTIVDDAAARVGYGAR